MNKFTLKAKNREELDQMIKRTLTLEEDEEFEIVVLKEPKKILFMEIKGEYLVQIVKKEEKITSKTFQPYEGKEEKGNKSDLRTQNKRNDTKNTGTREKKKTEFKEKRTERDIENSGNQGRKSFDSSQVKNKNQLSENISVKETQIKETDDTSIDKVRGFMKELIVHSKLELKVVNVVKEGDRYLVNLDGKDIRYLIGEKGSALNAVEYLLSSVKPLKNIKIVIDSNNYKKKREEALRDLARKKGKKVLDSGRSIKLNPMSARERKIIHEEISFIKGLKTESLGEEPKRYLVIKKIKDLKNENEV